MSTKTAQFPLGDCSRIIEMAWQDRVPFDAIERLYGLNESATINFMRRQMKPSSFRMWRQRVINRPSKHLAQRQRLGAAHDGD